MDTKTGLMNGQDECKTNADISVIESAPPQVKISESERRTLFWKVDLRLLSILTSIYLIQYIDRGNIGNAKIQGLTEQLELDSKRYAIQLTIFYVAYAVFEIPSNMLLRIFPPRIYLPTLVVCWGAIMMASGWCKDYKSFYACRFLLGVFEAGYFPGGHYFGFRIGIFFVCASLAGSFSGLLAFAFAHLSGVGGLLGWSWIFILEGAMTISVGLLAFVFLRNSFETVGYLSDTEKKWLQQELSKDRGLDGSAKEDNSIKIKELYNVLADWQTLPLALLALLTTVPVNALNQFLPSIINGMGYTSLNAQLLTIPVFASSIPFVLIVAYYSDKYQFRIVWLIIGYLIALVGWVILAAVDVDIVAPRLFACFLVGIGIYGGFAAAAALTAAQFGGKSKRAIGIATCNTFSGLSGIISSNAFRTSDAPQFKPGMYTAIGCCILGLVLLVVLFFVYRTINRRREEFLRTTDKIFTPEELAQMGDKAPTYKYSL